MIDIADDMTEVEKIKKQITIVNKALGTVHASYIGYLKWAIASNSQAMNVLKQAKKGANGAWAESFMGLALL